MRSLALLSVVHAAAALSTPARAAARPSAAPQLTMIEHELALMEPRLYEPALRAAFADRGFEVIRWYIARVDAAAGTAVAEVVILPHDGDDTSVGQ